VRHAKTFTTSVSVREVCQAIDKYAFATSTLPIIISAEVHCSLAQQELLADILFEEFGERLVSSKLHLEGLPSPDDLRGKILFKVCGLIGWDRFLS
jgi:phosphatidylinositol phospholipase C delta